MKTTGHSFCCHRFRMRCLRWDRGGKESEIMKKKLVSFLFIGTAIFVALAINGAL